MRPGVVERAWPALLVTCACIGLAAANWLRVHTGLLAAAAVVTVVAAVLAAGGRRLALVGVSLAAAGLWWGGLRSEALERSLLVAHVGETASARVVVTGPARRSRFATRAPAEVVRFGTTRVRERVLLELPAQRAPPQGVVLELRARPVEPRGPETGFDERGWLARQGVHVVLRGREPRVVGRRGGIGGVADRLRAHVEATLASGTTGERRALLTGIVLGEDSVLPETVRESFRRSGLFHLLAVSGQNVAITAVGVVRATRLLGVGRRPGEALAVLSVLAYALAVGWQPSVVRATVAGCLASLAWISARPRDRWHALAVGALVLLAWRPATVLEPGFQLSFAAVAAIFLGVPRVRRALDGYPVPRLVADLGAVAAVCGLVTAPIVWLHFHALPLWTVPANVLAEPAMPPLVALSLAGAAIEPVAPSAAAALAWLAGWCAWWIARVASVVGNLPAAELSSTAAVVSLGVAVVAALTVIRLPRPHRRGAVTALAACAVLTVAAWLALRPAPEQWHPPRGLRVTVLDVGQGDGILVEAPGAAVLVDQGPPEADVAGRLRRMGIRALTAIVLTHPQRDHVGGAAAVLRRLAVGTVLDPGLRTPSPDRAAALAVARQRGVPVVTVSAGDEFRIGRLTLRVVWPDRPGLPSEDPNLRATVILVGYRATDVLLTADAESDVTGRLLLRPVEVLKVAHHGSEDGGLPALLRTLRPRIAVISVGEGNDYGHPRAETVDALATRPGLRLYRTDRDGDVVIESDGRELTVRSGR